MATRLTQLAAYEDDRGNTIAFAGRVQQNIQIKFAGRGNRLVVADQVRIARLFVDFDCDNGYVEIGRSSGVPALLANIRVGQDATVRIGQNVSTTAVVAMSAAEGSTITIGDDVMFASENQIRADDGHPIFDVRTGERVNVSRSITIGNHVWLGYSAVVLGGATIGDGTVVGIGSIVTRPLPNNVVAAGVPARVVRRDIAWERPHLTLTRPFFKPDATTIAKSPYWNLTETGEVSVSWPTRARRLVRRALRKETLR